MFIYQESKQTLWEKYEEEEKKGAIELSLTAVPIRASLEIFQFSHLP